MSTSNPGALAGQETSPTPRIRPASRGSQCQQDLADLQTELNALDTLLDTYSDLQISSTTLLVHRSELSSTSATGFFGEGLSPSSVDVRAVLMAIRKNVQEAFDEVHEADTSHLGGINPPASAIRTLNPSAAIFHSSSSWEDSGTSDTTRAEAIPKISKQEDDICWAWRDRGHCDFGRVCRWRHGEEDWRYLQSHPRFDLIEAEADSSESAPPTSTHLAETNCDIDVDMVPPWMIPFPMQFHWAYLLQLQAIVNTGAPPLSKKSKSEKRPSPTTNDEHHGDDLAASHNPTNPAPLGNCVSNQYSSSHSKRRRLAPKAQICKFWARSPTACQNGDLCQFTHGDHNQPQKYSSTSGHGGQGPSLALLARRGLSNSGSSSSSISRKSDALT